MSRVKIVLPSDFSFSTIIPIRITDLNYGGHVGNDTVLSLVHEARMQFLSSYGYTEMKLEGISLIMSDAAIEFRNESFYGDSIKAYVKAFNFGRAGFDLYYKLVKEGDEKIIALAKTGMVCFNYDTRKIVSLPPALEQKLSL
ncbi:MAG: acyl-CoA thioesterase [Flavisolibacter sp.]